MIETLYDTPKEAAKALKRELNHAFPGVKFSVRSEIFVSGNSCIIVEYRPNERLPLINDVRAIAERYEDSEVDITDLVLPDPKHIVNDQGKLIEVGGATYVSVSNHLSSDVKDGRA